MTPSPPARQQAPRPEPGIVARLRAAGCVFAEDEARLLVASAAPPAELASMVGRRVAGLPLEHVLGWAEFCGLRIAVDPGVFVPRRRSEFLVRQAAALARRAVSPGVSPHEQAATMRPAVIVDLCCGSGAIGAAVAAALGTWPGPDRGHGHEPARGPVELHAVDLDPVAVACARRNLAGAGGRVYQGDLYQPLPPALRGRVDILVASPPYVPSADVGLLPAEARLHEPLTALDGGADGLDILRRVAAGAAGWLASGGCLLTEMSERQSRRAVQDVAACGLIARVSRSEELNATVVVGARPGPGC